jgi:AsmA protein
MRRGLKFASIALATVAGLLGVAAAIVAATFDPNDYKAALIERVQRDRQRTLAIPGRIQLSFFPGLGVKVGALSLSEPRSTQPFAAVRSARVSLAWLPLIRRRLVVDGVTVEGLQLQLTRFADGRTSVDDLLGPPHPAGGEPAVQGATQALQFDITGLNLADASITVDDRQQRRRLALTQATLRAGRIAPGTPGDATVEGHLTIDSPNVDADLQLRGRLLFDPAQQRHAVRGLGAELSGRVAGLSQAKVQLGGNADVTVEPLRLDLSNITFAAQGRQGAEAFEVHAEVPQFKAGEKDISAGKTVARLSFQQGPRLLKAELALPPFAGSVQAFKVPPIDGQISLDDGPLRARVRVTGAIDGDMNRLLFSSPQWTLALSGRHGNADIQGTLTSAWSADLRTQTFGLSHVAAGAKVPNPKGGVIALQANGDATLHLDRHRLDARLSGTLDQSRFDAKLGMTGFAPATYSFDIGIDRIDVDRYLDEPPPAKESAAADVPLDVSALRGLNATGSLRVGALQLKRLKANNLKLGLRAGGGRLQLNPLDADLYRGHAAGSLEMVSSTPARVALKQSLAGVSVGPLLADMFGSQAIEGRGNVVLDLAATGTTVKALQKSLSGSARIELHDGAVHGFNVVQTVRGAKAMLGVAAGARSGAGTPAEKTDFSELSGSFAVVQGVAHTEDLLAKSPLLRIAGRGDVDLGESRLDLVIRATVVNTLQGQGGPELQALRGQTVPVRLKGPFTAIGYSVDVASLAQDLARQKLEGKTGDLTDKLQKQLGDKLKGLFGK